MKKENIKSLIIGLTALICLALWLTLQPKRPEINPKMKVGHDLFENFTDPSVMQELSITRCNENGEPETLRLVKQNGIWLIPSFWNYPAENAEQMASVVSPLLHLTVLEVADEMSDLTNEKEIQTFLSDCGVLDPVTENDSGKSVGIAVRIVSDDGTVPVHMIVGNRVEESSAVRDVRYVRIPEQNTVYTVDFSMKSQEEASVHDNQTMPERLSVRPLDWVNRDLLRISRWNIRELAVHQYAWRSETSTAESDESTAETATAATDSPRLIPDIFCRYKQDRTNSLSRVWSLQEFRTANGRKYESREVDPENADNAILNDAADLLGHLQIESVLRKPDFLTQLLQNGRSLRELSGQTESFEKYGFHLADYDVLHPDQTEPVLAGDGGELRLTMDDGVTFSLVFGKADSGIRSLWITAVFDETTLPAKESLVSPAEYDVLLSEGQEKARVQATRTAPWFYLIKEEDYQKLAPGRLVPKL